MFSIGIYQSNKFKILDYFEFKIGIKRISGKLAKMCKKRIKGKADLSASLASLY